ncbi:hypothetical protein BDR22DRAFT_887922 [Usnea florida]
MAAADKSNEDQYPEELRLSLSRLGVVPNYSNIKVYRSDGSNAVVAGVGLRASVGIPFGFPIISESALFSRAKNAHVNHIQAGLDEFQALSCPTNPWTADGAFAANSFAMGKTGNREIQGIFPIASRLNHSCVPNAYFAWNYKSKTLTVHALTPIPSGNEILVDYRVLNYLKPGDERRQELSDDYHFDCLCPACQQNTDFSAASEDRRRQMRDLEQQIENDKRSTVPNVRNQRLGRIKKFILLLQQEGLVYPHQADMLKEEIDWYWKELKYVTTGAEHARYKARCLEEALQVARNKLYLDVACTGYNSPCVQSTLKLIDKLKLGGAPRQTEARREQSRGHGLRSTGR